MGSPHPRVFLSRASAAVISSSLAGGRRRHTRRKHALQARRSGPARPLRPAQLHHAIQQTLTHQRYKKVPKLCARAAPASDLRARATSRTCGTTGSVEQWLPSALQMRNRACTHGPVAVTVPIRIWERSHELLSDRPHTPALSPALRTHGGSTCPRTPHPPPNPFATAGHRSPGAQRH
jgi:hypothetical protein